MFPNACEVTHSVCVCVLGNSTWTTTTSTPFDVALRRLVTHQTREKAKWARPHLGQDWGCCHIFENWAFILPSFRLRLHSSNRSQSRTPPQAPISSPHCLSICILYDRHQICDDKKVQDSSVARKNFIEPDQLFHEMNTLFAISTRTNMRLGN